MKYLNSVNEVMERHFRCFGLDRFKIRHNADDSISISLTLDKKVLLDQDSLDAKLSLITASIENSPFARGLRAEIECHKAEIEELKKYKHFYELSKGLK